MKRMVLLVTLLAAYGAFFERRVVSEGPARLDPLGPQARQVERAIAEGRFADALPIALEVRDRYDRVQPLACYWLALIYHGLDRPAQEAEWWEIFIGSGGEPREACPNIADAYARLGDSSKTIGAYARCASLDREDPERLIDLGNAYDRAGQPGDALAAFQRAAALDPRNPVISRRVEHLTRAGAARP